MPGIGSIFDHARRAPGRRAALRRARGALSLALAALVAAACIAYTMTAFAAAGAPSTPTVAGGSAGWSSATSVTLSASGATVGTPGITPLIPAYWPATGSANDPWATVPPASAANGTPAIEVMNADSGPGTDIGGSDPTAAGLATYNTAIATAHTSGSRVYGYVWTNYANTGGGPSASIATVESQIDKWVANYHGIDGIFFDGTAVQAGNVGYYQTVDAYARAKGLKAIFNPGAAPDQSYMAIDPTSIIIDFEGTGASYLTTTFPSWTQSYPANRFAHLVFSTPSGSVAGVLARAHANNVGNLYVTNVGLPNPWGTLASYFAGSELAGMAPTTTTAGITYQYRTSTNAGVSWSAPVSGSSASVTNEGTTLVQFQAISGAGVASAWAPASGSSGTVSLDRTAPSVPSPTGGSASASTTPVTITATGSTDPCVVNACSGLAGYQYETSTNAGVTWSAPVAGSSVTISAPGTTWVQFRSLDTAGNASTWSGLQSAGEANIAVVP